MVVECLSVGEMCMGKYVCYVSMYIMEGNEYSDVSGAIVKIATRKIK